MILGISLWFSNLVGATSVWVLLYMKRKHSHFYGMPTMLYLSLLFFQFTSVKLCRAQGDLAQVSSSMLDSYTRDPSATNCSCHSGWTHQLIKALFLLNIQCNLNSKAMVLTLFGQSLWRGGDVSVAESHFHLTAWVLAAQLAAGSCWEVGTRSGENQSPLLLPES